MFMNGTDVTEFEVDVNPNPMDSVMFSQIRNSMDLKTCLCQIRIRVHSGPIRCLAYMDYVISDSNAFLFTFKK